MADHVMTIYLPGVQSIDRVVIKTGADQEWAFVPEPWEPAYPENCPCCGLPRAVMSAFAPPKENKEGK